MRIEEYEFWKIVESLGWGTKTTDYKAINQQLIDSGYDLNCLYKIFAKFKVELKHKISQWEQATGLSCDIGDDSFDDLASHIIGLGRKAYWSAINNPKLAYERAHNPYKSEEGYTESFAYIFN